MLRTRNDIKVAFLVASDWWSRVDVRGAADCWPWKLSARNTGYGQTWDGVANRLAHRVAWTLANGAIPLGLTVDHLCRNRLCCNPAHLRLLSNEENGRLNGNTLKDECKRGHAFTPGNTIRDHRGHRKCQACVDLWNASRRNPELRRQLRAA